MNPSQFGKYVSPSGIGPGSVPSPGLGSGVPAIGQYEDMSYGYPGTASPSSLHPQGAGNDPLLILLQMLINNRFPNGDGTGASGGGGGGFRPATSATYPNVELSDYFTSQGGPFGTNMGRTGYPAPNGQPQDFRNRR